MSVISEKLGPLVAFFALSAMEGSTRNAGASVAGSTSATALARSSMMVCADAFAGSAVDGFAGWTVETALALSHPAAAAAAFAGALA
jgi:hypothetical protein